MEVFVTNYKKTGQGRRTATFYRKQLSSFDQYWKEFSEVHLDILSYEDTDSKLEGNAYFASDVYSQVQEYFFENYDVIEQRFKREFPESGVEVAIPSNSTVKSTPAMVTPAIKLPKVELPTFRGDYRDWPTFRDLYETMIDRNDSLASVQKLQYLKMHLEGEPEQLLRHFKVTGNNYQAAWTQLKDRFENKRVLVNHELKILFEQPALHVDSANEIKSLLDTTSECLQALANMDVDVTSWDPLIVYITVQKLSMNSHQLWEHETNRTKELATWAMLSEFLEVRFRTLEAIADKERSVTQSTNSRMIKNSKSFYTRTNPYCPKCKGEHTIRNCEEYIKMDLSQRLSFAKSQALCMNCLSSNHFAKDCPSVRGCSKCGKRHHTLLHKQQWHSDSSNQTNQQIAGYNSDALNSFVLSSQENQVLLATALVKVITPDGKEGLVRALIDQGSQASFITESTVQQLNLRKSPVTACIQGIGNTIAGDVRSLVSIRLKSLETGVSIRVESLVMKRLTHLLPSKAISRPHWKHIRNLKLADPEFYKQGQVDLLLGADVYSQIIMAGLVKGPRGSPVAQETSLGWVLFGEVSAPTLSYSIRNFHVLSDLNNTLKRFWELEDISVESETQMSEEEQQCEQIFARTTRRLPNGRYQVELPLKQEDGRIILGKSRGIAEARLKSLVKSFSRNHAIRDGYVNCIEEYVEGGYMEKVEKLESVDNCYLPHHCVLKETSSTTKLRVVFDASRPTTNGSSLNDIMFKGPTIQDDLTTILIRFRKHLVALTADIKKMYLQICVVPHHAELQRIVWHPSAEKPIEDFKLTRVTFGTKCAPFLATRVLKQLAVDEGLKYPFASKIALSDFYVDDLLSGADSIEEAKALQTEMIQLMESGGFSLRKWNSNCPSLIQDLPTELVESKPTRSIDELEECVRTLGIIWKPNSDTFSFDFNLDRAPSVWTKRTILSEIAKVFDPLGWLSPFTILGKILLQKLWLNGTTWEEEIVGPILDEWLTYRKAIIDCACIHLDRWLQYSEQHVNTELHGFSDASCRAFAAAIYIRVRSSDGSCKITLIAAKTKVAPINTVSLPRLELCGAVLLVRLFRHVVKALNLPDPTPTFCWTDSEIVLAWLRSHPSKWKTFVANRVSFIHESMGSCSWRHVPSKLNPVDCASRGMYPKQLVDYTLWWNGPEYLLKSQEHWPKLSDPESRKVAVHLCVGTPDFLGLRISTLAKLQRVIAYCFRFTYNCRKSANDRETRQLTAKEIEKATGLLTERMESLHLHLKRQLVHYLVNLEQRKVIVHNCTNITEPLLEMRFSSLSRLQRVTAYCLRFIQNCRKSSENRDYACLTAVEIRRANQVLIKRAQKRHFGQELRALESKQGVGRKSKILKLYPFLDTDGIIKVGGRLRHAHLAYNQRHPIILAGKDSLSELIVAKVHLQTLHGGPQLTLNIIQTSYWIINAKNIIKGHIHRCMMCFRYKVETRNQLMGDLPAARLQVCRPFTNTGLDYCGPFELKTHKGRNPKKYKGYISLFVCMSTRAIHLELVTDYTAEGFIAAFRRFSSRRGLCSEIFCDCGTNFVGASRIIAKEYHQQLNQSKLEIAEWLEGEGVKFNFNPPASPHFGGLWEAGVRSVKHHLKRTIGEHLLTYEEFNTFITQIEACLNSRPLCPASSDPRDVEALTPGHFLIGGALLTPPEPNLDNIGMSRLDRWQLIQRLTQSFWKRWTLEYISRLQQRPKWNNIQANVEIGSLVLVKDENLPPSRWLLARVIETHPGSDGLVRVVTLKTSRSMLKRSITKICLLPLDSPEKKASEM